MQKNVTDRPGNSTAALWRLLRSWALIALGVLIAAHTSEGISYNSTGSLVLAVLLVSLLNVFLRPILMLFTLPFIILTLGVGLVVINALIIWLTGAIVPGFHVATFWSALWAAVVVALCTLLVNLLIGGGGLTVRVDSRRGAGDGPRAPSGSGAGRIPGRGKPAKDDDVIDV